MRDDIPTIFTREQDIPCILIVNALQAYHVYITFVNIFIMLYVAFDHLLIPSNVLLIGIM